MIEVPVPPENAGTRLDAFLADAVADISRNRVKALILTGQVAIGGRTVVEPKRPVNAGESVTLRIPEAVSAKPIAEAISLATIFEDDDLIVIDKPAGMVVHPAPGHSSGTLVNALLAHCGESLSGIGGVRRPGIVHRLDKNTSGLIVVAKTDLAHKSLAAQFANHGSDDDLSREYRALVWGAPSPAFGEIDAEIGRSSTNRQKMAVTPGRGRHAVTRYRTIAKYGSPSAPIASLLALQLETGRTHQIRVHLAKIGHPVIGDPAYGAGMATKAGKLPEPASGLVRAFSRQALHAGKLGFRHPTTGEKMTFEVPYPSDFSELMSAMESINQATITRF